MCIIQGSEVLCFLVYKTRDGSQHYKLLTQFCQIASAFSGRVIYNSENSVQFSHKWPCWPGVAQGSNQVGSICVSHWPWCRAGWGHVETSARGPGLDQQGYGMHRQLHTWAVGWAWRSRTASTQKQLLGEGESALVEISACFSRSFSKTTSSALPKLALHPGSQTCGRGTDNAHIPLAVVASPFGLGWYTCLLRTRLRPVLNSLLPSMMIVFWKPRMQAMFVMKISSLFTHVFPPPLLVCFS